jgi:hypothetical protein
MAIIREAADKIYEIKPEGPDLEHFPLCTVYLIVDDNAALVGLVTLFRFLIFWKRWAKWVMI